MTHSTLRSILRRDRARLRVETDQATITALRLRMRQLIAAIAGGGQ